MVSMGCCPILTRCDHPYFPGQEPHCHSSCLQVVLVPKAGESQDAISIDPMHSVSRIGSRAYPPVMEMLAPQLRLEMAQAADGECLKR